MKPSEILDRAANIILRDGWIQGSYFKGAGTFSVTAEQAERANKNAPCCQAGAISRAATGWAWWPGHDSPGKDVRLAQARADFYLNLHLTQGGYGHSAIAWNDDPVRTKEEVAEALAAAAVLAREGGE